MWCGRTIYVGTGHFLLKHCGIFLLICDVGAGTSPGHSGKPGRPHRDAAGDHRVRTLSLT